jgi:hypothetical protein
MKSLQGVLYEKQEVRQGPMQGRDTSLRHLIPFSIFSDEKTRRQLHISDKVESAISP